MKLSIILIGVSSAIALSDVPSNSSLVARDGGRTHIGYRVIKQLDLEALRRSDGVAGLPVEPGARQLGVGIYISPVFHDWPPKLEAGIDPAKYWDCRVMAEPGFWEGLKKAWIPRYVEPTDALGLQLNVAPPPKKGGQNCNKPPTLWGMLPFIKNLNRPRFLAYLDSSPSSSRW
ncbi:hypothetical protein VHEMI01332 [[Torrubiella] hemipterigena]|uniref:Uncharacterized protein n=1 Tax=[Torrubiella] hemipterigena TaxID=1531966 RepID=A0A0A1SLN7_9HYPO|nr:hypothetical protein VHEMI01332 [[Torrubiella] hemipterigena]